MIAPGFEPVAAAFQALADKDPTYSGQLCAYHLGAPVLDLAVGPDLTPDSLLPVFSGSKGAIGIVMALLLQRGQLDLDAEVCSYWPEFAARGKARITVRQLLSHQAGLLGVDGGYTDTELLEHTPLAERLAQQRPFWQPGSAFGYHALTIGTLADELVRRITGRTLAEVFRDDVAAPGEVDVHLGTPVSLDHRVATVDLPNDAELAEHLSKIPFPEPGSLGSLASPRSDSMLLMRVNDEDFRRVGPPAAGGLASARGLARMYALLDHDVDGVAGGRLLNDDTIPRVSQIQATGVEIGSGLAARFGIVFQIPNPPRLLFGSARAFGHDGAGGSLAYSDPEYRVSFGYTCKRIAMPVEPDPRMELSRLLRQCVIAR